MNRTKHILSMIDTKRPGLEIGPSFAPIAPKSAGFDVKILDHCDADALRKKYHGHNGVDPSKIETVDFIWTAQNSDFSRLAGGAKFGWIIASHVIEHTPDLITFLKNCESVLEDDGLLMLAVPDRRKCFDYHRTTTSLAQIIDAYAQKRTRHSVGSVVEHFRYAVKNGDQIAWGNGQKLTALTPIHTADQVRQFKNSAESTEAYIDVHAWVFTPQRFKLIIDDLNALGYVDLKITRIEEATGCEFFAVLGRGVSPAADRTQLLQGATREPLY